MSSSPVNFPIWWWTSARISSIDDTSISNHLDGNAEPVEGLIIKLKEITCSASDFSSISSSSGSVKSILLSFDVLWSLSFELSKLFSLELLTLLLFLILWKALLQAGQKVNLNVVSRSKE